MLLPALQLECIIYEIISKLAKYSCEGEAYVWGHQMYAGQLEQYRGAAIMERGRNKACNECT